MAQKREVRRQSDLPIFDYLEAMNPAHLWAGFRSMPRHQRWLVISIIASAIIAVTIIGLGRATLNHYLETRGRFLYDALESPYALEGRLLPLNPLEAQIDMILPDTVGRYHLQAALTEAEQAAVMQAQVDTVAQMAGSLAAALDAYEVSAVVAEEPVTEAEAADAAMIEQQQAALAAAQAAVGQFAGPAARAKTPADVLALAEMQAARLALYRLAAAGISLAEADALLTHLADVEAAQAAPVTVHDCLLAQAAPCSLSLVPAYSEPGVYRVDGGAVQVDVTIAMMDNRAEATRLMIDLFGFAHQTGQTGNYTLGVVEIDYFYSRLGDTFTFAWSNGNWVYIASSDSFTDLEAFIRALPY